MQDKPSTTGRHQYWLYILAGIFLPLPLASILTIALLPLAKFYSGSFFPPLILSPLLLSWAVYAISKEFGLKQAWLNVIAFLIPAFLELIGLSFIVYLASSRPF